MTIELSDEVEERLRSLAVRQGRDSGKIVEEAVLAYLGAAASPFSLEDEPVGALEVQEMSRSAGLEPDELSRALVQAREE